VASFICSLLIVMPKADAQTRNSEAATDIIADTRRPLLLATTNALAWRLADFFQTGDFKMLPTLVSMLPDWGQSNNGLVPEKVLQIGVVSSATTHGGRICKRGLPTTSPLASVGSTSPAPQLAQSNDYFKVGVHGWGGG
jgi:hypothetical protein